MAVLWGPLQDNLRSHAEGLEKSRFWNGALKPALETALHNAREQIDAYVEGDAAGKSNENDELSELLASLAGEEDPAKNDQRGGMADAKADSVNWRNLLWASMERFVPSVEQFHPVLVDLFFNFMTLVWFLSTRLIAYT